MSLRIIIDNETYQIENGLFRDYEAVKKVLGDQANGINKIVTDIDKTRIVITRDTISKGEKAINILVLHGGPRVNIDDNNCGGIDVSVELGQGDVVSIMSRKKHMLAEHTKARDLRSID